MFDHRDESPRWWEIISTKLQRSRRKSKHRAFTRNLQGAASTRHTKNKAARKLRASLRRQKKGHKR